MPSRNLLCVVISSSHQCQSFQRRGLHKPLNTLLFADDRHAAVQASWSVYQRLIQAYRTEEAGLGKYLMQRLIDSLKQAIPDGLEEIQALARTLTERASDTPGLLRPAPYLQRPH